MFSNFLVELKFYVITATATAVINFSTTATVVFKNTTTEAITATAVFWKLTTNPSPNYIYIWQSEKKEQKMNEFLLCRMHRDKKNTNLYKILKPHQTKWKEEFFTLSKHGKAFLISFIDCKPNQTITCSLMTTL